MCKRGADMEKTPASMRKYIGIFGNTNSGKSTLFNALLGQNMAIVSPQSGTTTDPVSKAMELLGYGAVTLFDTAGFGDATALGTQRTQKTKDILKRCDLAILVEDISAPEKSNIDFGSIPTIKVYTKCDKLDADTLENKKQTEPDAVYIKEYSESELSALREKMVELLREQNRDDETFLGNILKSGSTVILVIPIDSAAPKGRLILPQVQVLRDCLDHNITAICTAPDMLEKILGETNKVDLVICDSQIFGEVSKIVTDNVELTSFSILLANKSGRIKQLIDGTKVIENLKDNDKILMLEACTHSTTHEDIGRVKIPQMLQNATGKKLSFTHRTGYDFSEDFFEYDLIIQCGGCMINKRTVQNRLEEFEKNNIPVTNYGVVLAYLNGILDKASGIFIKNN